MLTLKHGIVQWFFSDRNKHLEQQRLANTAAGVGDTGLAESFLIDEMNRSFDHQTANISPTVSDTSTAAAFSTCQIE